DILINNAGTLDHVSQLENQNDEFWQRDLNVNLTGTYNCTKAVWPYMKEQGDGRIINMSSVAGTLGGFGQASYSATKGGILSFTKSMALEGARLGINVNAIVPGIIETEAFNMSDPKMNERMKKRTAFRKPGKPEDIANAIVVLVSDKATYITGVGLNVSGGIELFTFQAKRVCQETTNNILKGGRIVAEVVIVDAIRTATGKRDGAFSSMHPVDMLSPILKALVERNDLEPDAVEDVVTGCVSMTDEQGGNIGRMAVLAAGFPVEVPAFSLNRMCGSSQQAIHSAAQAILAGDVDIAIACGVDNMTRVPMGSDMGSFCDDLVEQYSIVPQGFSAEMIADKWGLSREELDAFSLESHHRAAKAADSGAFDREILPIDINGDTFKHDEGIRRNT